MASCQQLDASGRARMRKLICLSLFFVAAVCSAAAQEIPSDADRLAAAQKAFDAGRWQDAANLAQGPAGQSSDFDFVRGLALARLQHWNEARLTFEAGHAKAPRQARLLGELAGGGHEGEGFPS